MIRTSFAADLAYVEHCPAGHTLVNGVCYHDDCIFYYVDPDYRCKNCSHTWSDHKIDNENVTCTVDKCKCTSSLADFIKEHSKQ